VSNDAMFFRFSVMPSDAMLLSVCLWNVDVKKTGRVCLDLDVFCITCSLLVV
jgi:hypothetical protein